MSNTITVNGGTYRIKISKKELHMEMAADGSRVLVKPLDARSEYQKWTIREVSGHPNTYTIANLGNQLPLVLKSGGSLDSYGNGYLYGESGKSAEWIMDFSSSGGGVRFTTYERKSRNLYVDSCDEKTAHFWKDNQAGVAQHWAFELVKADDNNLTGPSAGNGATGSSKGFAEKFFSYTLKDAAKEEFDIIIVGSGIGGGILANDLYDTNVKMGAGSIKPVGAEDQDPGVTLPPTPKRILLLEKGGLVFHSHCLNTARPVGLAKDRGQQNDTFFSDFKDDYNIFSPSQTEDPNDAVPLKAKVNPSDYDTWKGGPMYNLGGRSAAWGLFAPRVHDHVLKERFPLVADDLLREYYDKSELLMKISSPKTRRIHQHIMDRLNMISLGGNSTDLKFQWQWGRIASEFKDERNFDFAEGAYATMDKIIEIAMSRPKPKGADKPIEHEHFKTILNADVRSLSLDDNRTVTGVVVKDLKGEEYTIKVKGGDENERGKVVLAAGSVHSPAILMRSPNITHRRLDGSDQNGLRLTDHDIWFYSHSFTYDKPSHRDEYGAMKLQSYCTIEGKIMLLNMSLDASSFLPRGKSAPGSHAQMIFVWMTQSALAARSNIKIVNDEPRVTMVRGTAVTPEQKKVMAKMVSAVMTTLRTTAKFTFQGCPNEQPIAIQPEALGCLEMGGVAHELGTLPMKVNNSDGFCVDENLRVKPALCKGAYVCDLSVFPWSPAANPTLTLAALAIRLSRHLHPRRYVVQSLVDDKNIVKVVNHSGARVKVWLTYRRAEEQQPGQPEPYRVLPPGAYTQWTRVEKVPQGLFIYRLDDTVEDTIKFMDEPTLMTAQPGVVNSIHY